MFRHLPAAAHRDTRRQHSSPNNCFRHSQLDLRAIRGPLPRLTSRMLRRTGLFSDRSAAPSAADLQLVEDPLASVLDPGDDGVGGPAGAVAEVVCVALRHRAQLVDGAALVGRHAVGVEVGLQVGRGPGVEGVVLGRVRGRGQVAGHGGVRASAGL